MNKFTLDELRVFLECMPLAKIGIERNFGNILKGKQDIRILEVFIGDSGFDILVYLDDPFLVLKLRTYTHVDTFAYPTIGRPNLKALLDFLNHIEKELKRLIENKVFEECVRAK